MWIPNPIIVVDNLQNVDAKDETIIKNCTTNESSQTKSKVKVAFLAASLLLSYFIAILLSSCTVYVLMEAQLWYQMFLLEGQFHLDRKETLLGFYCLLPYLSGKSYIYCPLSNIHGASKGRNDEHIEAKEAITEAPINSCYDQPLSQCLTVDGSSKQVN